MVKPGIGGGRTELKLNRRTRVDSFVSSEERLGNSGIFNTEVGLCVTYFVSLHTVTRHTPLCVTAYCNKTHTTLTTRVSAYFIKFLERTAVGIRRFRFYIGEGMCPLQGDGITFILEKECVHYKVMG